MPKLIVTSRYLKKGAVKKLQNYVKYIATREGSVPVKENSGNEPATEKQCELIMSLLREFPDRSALISEIIENNADRISKRENYIGYLANRPGAVKFDTHALFSQEDTPIDLNAVAKEIANHGGNVWTHVVALRRDNAQRMGYDNLTAWRELVKRQIPNIAKAQKIDMQNLRWYAAFHDKETNPHVHIVVYSTDEREGFLTKTGIEQIRSGFANDIYQDELHHLYARQTEVRDLLKKESAELMQQLSAKVQSNTSFEPELCQMIQLCRKQLQESKGKKVYGYLKPEVKRTVDRIFKLLASNESIQKMYDLWCEMEQQKHDVYSSAKITPPSLVDNPQFKSVKNMIIRAVLDMQTEPIISEIEIPMQTDDMPSPEDFKWNPDGVFETEVEPSEQTIEDEIDRLAVLADQGKMFAAYKLGRMYLKGDKVPQDKDKAEHYLKMASDAGNEYAQYLLAKLYLTEKKNIPDAISLLESAAEKNSWASYQLGRLYLFGTEEVKRDVQQAMQWLTKSAEDGNEQAEQLFENMEQSESAAFASTIFGLFVSLSHAIEDDYNKNHKKLQSKVDSKIQQMIRKHKQELGIREEHGMTMQ